MVQYVMNGSTLEENAVPQHNFIHLDFRFICDWFSLANNLDNETRGYDVEIHKMLDFADPIGEYVICVILQTEIP